MPAIGDRGGKMRIEFQDNAGGGGADCAFCGDWVSFGGRIAIAYDGGQPLGAVCVRCFDAETEELRFRMLAYGQRLRSIARDCMRRAELLEAAGPVEKPTAAPNVPTFPVLRAPWLVSGPGEDEMPF